MNRQKNYITILLFLLIASILIMSLPPHPAYANTADQYGILIADSNGSYTWYDLNDTSSGAYIEITPNGKIMLPAWKFASLIPDIKYSYNKQTKTMTMQNTYNGRKITVESGSSQCIYYASSKSKGIIKEMPYKMYISKDSKAVMISADTVKWIMNYSSGYKYYKPDVMQAAGYDTYSYKALFAYNPYNSIDDIPKATKVKGLSHTIKVTIPEGYSVVQTFDLLVKKGVCTSVDVLYDACNNYDFSYYPLVGELEENNNRCFRLEGYLFPDTYDFFRLSSGQDAIGRFLRNTEKKITDEMRTRAVTMGYTMNEIVTIASIIEKEINIASEMPNVASVIYNRLHQKIRLQVDATSYYVERYIKSNITGDINRYNNFYNTYKCTALPEGPICSPGINAIKAALYPAETDALFFCSDANGKYYYSSTYSEHLRILEEIRVLEEKKE